jgi:hypothetical protein
LLVFLLHDGVVQPPRYFPPVLGGQEICAAELQPRQVAGILLEREVRHLAVEGRGYLVMRLHRVQEREHLNMTRTRCEDALVARVSRLRTEIGNVKSRRKDLHADVQCGEIVMKGVIGDEHVGARLLFAAGKIAPLVVANLRHRRCRPALIGHHYLRHVDFDHDHPRVRSLFAERLIELVRDAQRFTSATFSVPGSTGLRSRAFTSTEKRLPVLG